MPVEFLINEEIRNRFDIGNLGMRNKEAYIKCAELVVDYIIKEEIELDVYDFYVEDFAQLIFEVPSIKDKLIQICSKIDSNISLDYFLYEIKNYCKITNSTMLALPDLISQRTAYLNKSEKCSDIDSHIKRLKADIKNLNRSIDCLRSTINNH